MVTPDVKVALDRAGLPTEGQVSLYHATTNVAATAIEESRHLRGSEYGQAWLASSPEIAALHHGGGATTTPDAPSNDVEVVIHVRVDAEDLYLAKSRPGEDGEIELFYLLDDGDGCPISVEKVEPWEPGDCNQ